MIKEMRPLSMAEASVYLEDEEVKTFFKKFAKAKPEEAGKIWKEVESLGSVKIRPEHIAKIIDIIPEDNQDVAKIFNDLSLDENETTKILEIVKKYK